MMAREIKEETIAVAAATLIAEGISVLLFFMAVGVAVVLYATPAEIGLPV